MNNRLETVDNQFEAMSESINKALEAKKEALVKMYRKDPRVSRDDAVSSLNKIIEEFNDICITKQIVHCENFSYNNKNVEVSGCQGKIRYIGRGRGYCFLDHPRTGNDTILKWKLRIPRFNYLVGKVTNVTLRFFIAIF